MTDLKTRPPVPPTEQHERNERPRPFPTIVYRYMPANYISRPLELFNGPTGVKLSGMDSWVQHQDIPIPVLTITEELRLLIEQLVSDEVRALKRFECCIVWVEGDCTYFERDGRSFRSKHRPSAAIML